MGAYQKREHHKNKQLWNSKHTEKAKYTENPQLESNAAEGDITDWKKGRREIKIHEAFERNAWAEQDLSQANFFA